MAEAHPPTAPGVDGSGGLDEVAAEALRRLEAMVRGRVSPAAYQDLVVDFVGGEVLAERGESDTSVPGDVEASAEALLARLSGVLLVEQSRRQGNRARSGSRHVAD